MNRTLNLRSILARSLVAAMALEAVACCEGLPPGDTRVVELRESNKWSALIENCRDDQSECESLCRLVLQEIEREVVDYEPHFLLCELDESPAVPLLTMEYDYYSDGCGRRPMTASEAAPDEASSSRAAYFVRAALLEAAAVQAFHEMAGQLLGFGAPASLVERCRRAAQEELGHALCVSRLARELGGDASLLPALRTADQIWRDARMGTCVHAPTLFEFARHNAVEGCVGESLGAAVALWQSVHSTDPMVRRILAGIAEEEAAHAQLSWDIDSWCRSRLSAEERNALAQARLGAGASLWTRLSANDNEAGGIAGLPGTAACRQLLNGIAGATWSARAA